MYQQKIFYHFGKEELFRFLSNKYLEDNLRKDREVADIQREGFRKAHKAGVKMVYGTDSGVHPHGDNGNQFRWMVQYGMTPAQAMQTATANAAEALAALT